jgi:Glycosyltransferase family 92
MRHLPRCPYLREWIEFHRLVGVERFYLYDNLSTDDHHTVLEPYVASGIAVVHERPVPFSFDALVETARQCMSEHRDDARWISFLDVDEFLFSPTSRPVAEVLRDYERWPAVYVQRLNFGSSGHVTRPSGFVIENYLTRRRRSPHHWIWGQVKVIADPKRVERCDSPHFYVYSDGVGVDEQKHPIDGGRSGRDSGPPISFERLRVNHYVTKSEQEYEEKLTLWNESETPRTYAARERENWDTLNRQPDDTITRYVPALRDALSRRSP